MRGSPTRARDGDALALSSRQGGAAFADHRVVAFRQAQDEVMRAGELAAPTTGEAPSPDRRGRCCRDRAVEQHVLLQHDADLAPQPCLVGHGEVHAVDQHAPAFRYIKSLDQLGDRALARTGKADDAHDLPAARLLTSSSTR